MSVILRQPANLNFLSPLGYKFVINKTPNVDYMVQAVNIPQVGIGVANQETPFVTIPRPGDHLKFGPLSILFKIDENMQNYLELYNWFIGMGFPDSFEQAKAVYGGTINEQLSKDLTGQGAYSDAILTVLDSSMQPKTTVTFYNIFPTGLDQVQFDSRNTTVNYIDCTCTFAYQKFKVDTISNLTTF